MATRDEMSKIITDMDIDTKAWIVGTAWDDFEKFPEDFTKTVIWYALRHAEEEGQCYNEPHGDSKWCTYWKVGNYIITYCTDGEYFITDLIPTCAEMLTEDMMDDLIIEEA